MNLDYLQGIISPIFDLWIFYKVFKYKFARKDIIFSLIFIALSIIFSFYKNSTDFFRCLTLYEISKKEKNKRVRYNTQF